jgi:outer membrane beta-barrel protein
MKRWVYELWVYKLMKISFALFVVPTLLLLPALARAEDEAPTYAIQNREFRAMHEIDLSIGILPLNAFEKGLTVGGSYTFHFTDFWGWEIADFNYSFNLDTDLKTQLLQNFSVQPTQISSLNYMLSSNLVLKPLYGKFAWANHSVVHAELSALLGPAVARYINPGAFRPGLDIGIYIRLYLARNLSVRFDVREYLFANFPAIANELDLMLSLAISFGARD